MRGISIGSLFLILLIVLVLFGGKRLRNIGEDLSVALQSFRKGMKQESADNENENKK